jgi:exopolysaccharide production protein ExoY
MLTRLLGAGVLSIMNTTVDHLCAVPKNVVGMRRALRERLYIGLNRFAAVIMLIVLSPIMLAVIGAIRRDGGSVLFTHYRVGSRGQLFKCLKFRSMIVGSEQLLQELLEKDPSARAEWERDQKLKNDPRITRIGRVLRATSLDELPQLINVARGEMALVGPRPITLEELKRYGPTKWHYLAVLPGLTGLWQVSGRNTTTYEERVRLDEYYVKSRSAWLDMKILVKTVHVVITKDGAC